MFPRNWARGADSDVFRLCAHRSQTHSYEVVYSHGKRHVDIHCAAIMSTDIQWGDIRILCACLTTAAFASRNRSFCLFVFHIGIAKNRKYVILFSKTTITKNMYVYSTHTHTHRSTLLYQRAYYQPGVLTNTCQPSIAHTDWCTATLHLHRWWAPSSFNQALLVPPDELCIHQESVDSVPKLTYVSCVYIVIMQFN